MRGKTALYDKVFPVSLPEQEGTKGHRNSRIEERDEALTHRYYFYGHLRRLRYDDCLIHLSDEFFLSTNVIIQRLALRTECLKQLIEVKTSCKELQDKYPYFNWSN